jgi:hypothetical protein
MIRKTSIDLDEGQVQCVKAGVENHFDALLPDYVLDPGIGAITGVPVPVMGILRMGSQLLASSRQRLAVAINRSVVDLTVNSIINGCSAVEVHVPMAGINIVDPNATALRAVAFANEFGFADPERTAV